MDVSGEDCALTKVWCKLKKMQKQEWLKKRKRNQSQNVTAQLKRLKQSVFLFPQRGSLSSAVRMQTKQIKTQTAWRADCGWGLKICWQDKWQVVIHVLIAQQCHPEAGGWLVSLGQQARSRRRLLNGSPCHRGAFLRSQFPLTTVQTGTWDFPLRVAHTPADHSGAKATPGLRHSPPTARVPHRADEQTSGQANALLSWHLSCCPRHGGTGNTSYLQRPQLWLEMTQENLVQQKLIFFIIISRFSTSNPHQEFALPVIWSQM